MNRYLICALILSSLFGCSGKSKKDSDLKPEEFPVVEVFTKDLNVPLEYVTNIQAYQNVEIRARVEGYLEEILVDEGKLVKEGQLLFRINDDEYHAELDRAKANIASAEAETRSSLVELERVKLLVNKNVVAKTELDLAEAKVEIARSKIKIGHAEETAAEIKLANTNIRSPFNGIIDLLPLKKGSLINEGTLLTTISNIETMYAYFTVSEVEYLEFARLNRKNDSVFVNNVELFLADETRYPSKGKIETLGSEFQEGTGAITARVKFKNPLHTLKHGATGKVRLHEVLAKAILVPQKSVLEIQDKNYVFLLDTKTNIVTMKSFIPFRRFGDYYIVTKGLNEHDLIVFEGIQDVREGMVIQPRKVSTEELLKTNELNSDK
ncbi:MAG TPA: efflux RND transporter periplasmic adaptor subunit [Cyclobacteriaceae bacterium]|jgi:membrane fusion protein (multidrug efflux system)|nr:efflux RND transporter periplasmic adaptor subunit [Cyclobacteriaceae bacterium]